MRLETRGRRSCWAASRAWLGLVVGLVNALLIAVFRISAFMVTLGMASVASGAALLRSGGTPVVGLPREFSRQFGASMVLGVPFPAIILGAAYVFLNWTRIGRQAYAVGGNESAAFQSARSPNQDRSRIWRSTDETGLAEPCMSTNMPPEQVG
ncbi:ABC transporter permease [Streptomyces sp. NPDC002596]